MRNPSVLRSTPFPFPQSDKILRSSTCANFEAPCSLSLYLAMGCAQLRAGVPQVGQRDECTFDPPSLPSFAATAQVMESFQEDTHVCARPLTWPHARTLARLLANTLAPSHADTLHARTLARSHTHSMHAFIRVYVYIYI